MAFRRFGSVIAIVYRDSAVARGFVSGVVVLGFAREFFAASEIGLALPWLIA